MIPDALKEPVRASAEEAQNFITLFYRALNDSKPISSFYINNNPTYRAAGHKPADICINGALFATPEEYDAVLAKQRSTSTTTTTAPTPTPGTTRPTPSPVRHDVAAFDAHVLNPDYRFAAPPELLAPSSGSGGKSAQGVRVMVLVSVSGTLVLGADPRHQEKRRFTENFILVPNWDAIARHGSKATRRFLIASDQYRCD
ncbi:hypothetical protein B0T18DRAFT_436469 [Schizothecium vesticola]|uniref:NTF2 domain-containing protein n=1 Tax=Schizothecium vesticola TaxID=314040 RepID=A0AA40F7I5_9PEZI|nr:hypothetical protein B0T18DRAFT_436469 [Schizothecium vesticola]